MAKRIDYTTLANFYTAKYPVLTYIGIQINFWIIANLLLTAIITLHAKIISNTFGMPVEGRTGPLILIAIILGILYGTPLGLAGYYLEKKVFRRLPMGAVILLKSLGSLTLLGLLLMGTRYALVRLSVWESIYPASFSYNANTWKYTYYLLLVYYTFMSLLINFINQVNGKYGPGIMVPLLLGRFRHPREEERIFLFMDLKSSTAIAEKLGHLSYSTFIRDCFMDINDVLMPFQAQVYQYVGDEIVVTWPQVPGTKNGNCIRFFFACKDKFLEKSAHYLEHYGFLPEFKAGAHAGMVTVVEIGNVKRDIAYHGDVLNTAARIQSVCNQYQKDFLASETLLTQTGPLANIQSTPLGMIQLKGKSVKVGIAGLERIFST